MGAVVKSGFNKWSVVKEIGLGEEKGAEERRTELRNLRALLAQPLSDDIQDVVERVKSLNRMTCSDTQTLSQMVESDLFKRICDAFVELVQEKRLGSWREERGQGDGANDESLEFFVYFLARVSVAGIAPQYFNRLDLPRCLLSLLRLDLGESRSLSRDSTVALLTILLNLSLSTGCSGAIVSMEGHEVLLDAMVAWKRRHGPDWIKGREALLTVKMLCNLAGVCRDSEVDSLAQNCLPFLIETARGFWADKAKDWDTTLLVWIFRAIRNLCRIRKGRERLTYGKGLTGFKLVLEVATKSRGSANAELNHEARALVVAAMGEHFATSYWEHIKEDLANGSVPDPTGDKLSKLLNEEIASFKSGKDFHMEFSPNLTEKVVMDAGREQETEEALDLKDYLIKNDSPSLVAGEIFELPEEPKGTWRVVSKMPSGSIKSLKCSYIQQLSAAALNSKFKLVLYFGIGSDGKIEGLPLDREMRDQFRMGVDSALTRGLRPRVSSALYSLNFLPIRPPSELEAPTEDDPLFLVKFRIHQITDMHYQLINGLLCLKGEAEEEVRKVNAQTFIEEVLGRGVER